jgi:enediyne biosynthesis protein E4
LQDRLYLNDGHGKFTRKMDALPAQKPVSTACVRPYDVDADGDIDVFVGMRMMPGNYGQPVGALILENDGKGKFTPETQNYGALQQLGMVTDAVWADLDGDKDEDLVVVGEWEEIRFFENKNHQLKEVTGQINLKNSAGWWNCIKSADLDGDGDQDFVIGNHGLNSRFKASPEKPISLYLNDFDNNTWNEPILCQYNGDKSYPMALRNDFVKQMPSLKKRFLKFEDYKNKTIQEIFSPDLLSKSLKKEATQLQSCVLWNDGNGHFSLTPLPYQAQLAPMYAVEIQDFTNDGRLDILLGGNHERCKPETGIYLASRGLLLEGVKNTQEFKALSPLASGLNIEGSIRDFLVIGKRVLVARNNRSLEILIR